MNRRTISQAVAGLFMAAFGITGIWCIHRSRKIFVNISQFSLPDDIFAYGLLAFVGIVGLWALVLASMTAGDPDRNLPGFLQAYADAWRKLVSQKWPLWLVGSLALISVLGALIEYGLSWHYLSEELRFRFLGENKTLQSHPILAVALGVQRRINSMSWQFIPNVSPSNSGSAQGLAALALLIPLPWASRRLNSIGNQPEYSSAARFVRSLIIPVAVLCIADAAFGLYLRWYTYAHLALQMSGAVNTDYSTKIWAVLNLVGYFTTLLTMTVVLGGVLTGGLAGSLRRSTNRETVDLNSFLANAVEFFKPLAGLFLLVNIVPFLFTLPSDIAFIRHMNNLPVESAAYLEWFAFVWKLVPILLMFAPFVITDGNASIWKGVSGSVKAWVNCGYNLLSFTALGVMGLTVMPFLKSFISQIIPRLLWAQAVWSVLFSIVTTFAGVFMAVAVWEFYQQIRAHSAESITEENPE
ncbi:MAG TPA: hypothetical protein VGK34_05045 [Armatimonadota bacterium]|jgi:hypothetical protein